MPKEKVEAGQKLRKIHGQEKTWRRAKNLGKFTAKRKSGGGQKIKENSRPREKVEVGKKRPKLVPRDAAGFARHPKMDLHTSFALF